MEQVYIHIKHPSKKLEAFVKELGVKKHERLEALRNYEGKVEEVRVNEKSL